MPFKPNSFFKFNVNHYDFFINLRDLHKIFYTLFSHPHRVLKDPKGNPFYSIRTEELPEAGIAILRKMKELNPLYQRLDAF